MFSFTELLKKFLPVVAHRAQDNDPAVFVTIGELLAAYKNATKGNSAVNQKEFIDRFNLACIYIKKRRNGDVEVVNIRPDQFKPQAMTALVDVNQLNERTDLHRFIARIVDRYQPDDEIVKQFGSDLISAASPADMEETKESEDQIDLEEMKRPAVAPGIDEMYPLLELEEHEHFRDVDGNPVQIMMRGERSPGGILLRAADVARFFGQDRLIELLGDTRSPYEESIHFLILSDHSGSPGIPGRSSKIPTEHSTGPPKRRHVSHDSVFLTWLGLHRVIFASRSGNANIEHMSNWITKLTYVHQFGSANERADLASTLLSFTCLHKIPLNL
jgi:hypothetical protein